MDENLILSEPNIGKYIDSFLLCIQNFTHFFYKLSKFSVYKNLFWKYLFLIKISAAWTGNHMLDFLYKIVNSDPDINYGKNNKTIYLLKCNAYILRTRVSLFRQLHILRHIIGTSGSNCPNSLIYRRGNCILVDYKIDRIFTSSSESLLWEMVICVHSHHNNVDLSISWKVSRGLITRESSVKEWNRILQKYLHLMQMNTIKPVVSITVATVERDPIIIKIIEIVVRIVQL